MNNTLHQHRRSILIVGGKLQGIEACYLARKAGIRTTLVDINPLAPARGLCDEFLCADLFEEDREVLSALEQADMVLPAMESEEVLEWLAEKSRQMGFALAFDLPAYRITSSKLASDRLFHQLGIPAPAHYPDGGFPYFAKPVSGSGSDGVGLLDSSEKLRRALGDPNYPENLIIQEYLAGPSYSLEIIGRPGNYRTYAVTKIHMDEVYDCNRVTTPCALTAEQERDFRRMAETLAGALGLSGIMDLEVIDDRGVLKLLEIDARIPSQTPAAILHSTGINLLAELYDLIVLGDFDRPEGETSPGVLARGVRWASYEHYLVAGGEARPLGEHIMTQGGTLHLASGKWGADEALTDYEPGTECWRGIFLIAGDSPEALEARRKAMQDALGKGISHE